ncbi:MAG: VWA-like domain-containing protein [Eubacterium sp.]|nr:VWA-like domain-containing protein [Eubacterium sp.]
MDKAQQIKTLKRLSGIRADLLNKFPFFGQLVMKLDLGLASCGTAFTDMERLRFDPEFVGRLDDQGLFFLMMHEVMHCVLQHPVRGIGKHHFIYNVACDIVVNSNILDYMGLEDILIDGEYAMHLSPSHREGKLMTAEEVYEELMKERQLTVRRKSGVVEVINLGSDEGFDDDEDDGSGGIPVSVRGRHATPGMSGDDDEDLDDEDDEDGDEDGDEGGGDGKGGKTGKSSKGGDNSGKKKRHGIDALPVIDEHDWEDIKNPGEKADRWKEIVIKVIRDGFGGTAGLPPAVRKIKEEMGQEAKMKWRDLLWEFLEMNLSLTDYSFAPPDRRFNDGPYLLPGENIFPEEEVQNIWFCIDTSGSITDDILGMFMSEVRGMLDQIKHCSASISFFDTTVTDPVPFTNPQELAEIKPWGGGGTRFDVIFSYMEVKMHDNLPKAIVILTDGMAADVPESMAMGVPVMWVLTERSQEKSWGRNVFIGDAAEE